MSHVLSEACCLTLCPCLWPFGKAAWEEGTLHIAHCKDLEISVRMKESVRQTECLGHSFSI